MAELLFIGSTLFSLWCLFTMFHKDKRLILLGGLWLFITGLLAYNGFFHTTTVFPPRIVFAVIPALLFVIIMVAKQKSENLSQNYLLTTHLVRIPVEFGLYLLFKEKLVPELMTFSGWNYDILIGLSAIPVLFLWNQHKLNDTFLMIWNIVGVCFLLFIVVLAVLSAPLPIQVLAFDQPNIAVLCFPYIWLPTVIVPTVLLAHCLAIKKLLLKKNKA